jgi:hypothetical protein
MIVLIPDSVAAALAAAHPNVRRAQWPNGANWYFVFVDDSFKDKDAIFSILTTARLFISGGRL